MTTILFRNLLRPLAAALALLLAAISLAQAQDITVATVELRYITLDLHGNAVSPGEAVYVTSSDGQMLQFRIEKVLGSKASALPRTSLQGITAGAVVMRGSAVGKTSVAGAYKQDAPLMSAQDTARARQAQAERDERATAASRAGRNAFIGAIGAMASGGNPAAVNMNAQAYYAQQQANAANGNPVDNSSAADLSTQFGQGASGQVPGGQVGRRSAPTMSQNTNADADRISQQCKSECSGKTQEAQAGSMRASYEAAACTCICFYRAVPPTYPGRASIKQCAIENSRRARELGSNAPVFVGD
jgi:hypothetical protein